MSLSTLDLKPGKSIACTYTRQSVPQLLQTRGVLAVVSFCAHYDPGEDPRHHASGLPLLSGELVNEVWYTSGDVYHGYDNNCSWSSSDEMLFASCVLECFGEKEDLTGRVEQAYADLLALITGKGYSHIVRMWNYLPGINLGAGDRERYRQFCAGRQEAFSRCRYKWEMYPSACALGSSGEGMIIYLIAAKNPVTHIENPSQVSAYHYPRQYGSASPSFARATLTNWLSDRQLYVSGTASIVGHETLFEGDLEGQLRTTFSNIESLLAHSAEMAEFPGTLEMALLKVYVRNASDYAAVYAAVSAQYPGVPAVYLRADICRRELLVEIDGLCELPPSLAQSRPVRSATHE